MERTDVKIVGLEQVVPVPGAEKDFVPKPHAELEIHVGEALHVLRLQQTGDGLWELRTTDASGRLIDSEDGCATPEDALNMAVPVVVDYARSR